MTHREALDKECRDWKKMYLVGYIIFFGAILGLIFSQGRALISGWFYILMPMAIIGWILSMAGSLKLWYQFRCMICRGRLGILAFYSGKSFFRLGLPPEYRHCFYCGASFDAELK